MSRESHFLIYFPNILPFFCVELLYIKSSYYEDDSLSHITRAQGDVLQQTFWACWRTLKEICVQCHVFPPVLGFCGFSSTNN